MRKRPGYKNTNTSSKLNFDKTLIFLTVILLILGMIAVADASAPQALAAFNDSYYFAKQQMKWVAAGIIFLVAGASINYKYYKLYARYIFIFAITLLILVLVPGFGSKLLGARRWLSLGPASFQPSEFAKLSMAIYMAYLIDKKEDFIKIIATVGAVAALVMLQPDMGTNMVIMTIAFGQMFIGGVPLVSLFGSLAAGGVLGLILILTSDYRRGRLMTFLHMSSDPLGESYHLKQILIAIGSGGFFGVGLGMSRQKHLFLPETASDSIFAVIAEEIGLFGSILLISLLTFYVMRLLRVSKNAPDNFSRLLASGISLWIGGQMFLNLFSMLAITPLTGIPLPFFSYGGSSLVMILFAVGILLNISHYSHEK